MKDVEFSGRPASARHAAHPAAPVPRPAPHDQPCRVGGGGNVPRSGEISLAHGGVLFLNKLQNPYLPTNRLCVHHCHCDHIIAI